MNTIKQPLFQNQSTQLNWLQVLQAGLLALTLIIVPSISLADGVGETTTGGPQPDGDEDPPCDDNGSEGDPVFVFDGRERDQFTDLVVNGVIDIELERTYDSNSRYDSPLGYGWVFTFDRRLYEYPDGSVTLRYDCGRKTNFLFTGGAYQLQPGALEGTLVSDGSGGFSFTYTSGKVDVFDNQGRLIAVKDISGNQLELLYTTDKEPLIGTSPFAVDPNTPMITSYHYQVTRIQERLADNTLSGHYVDFAYSPTTGRLTQAAASDGRVISYEHDTTAGLTRGNLTRVVGLEGYESIYKYEDPNDDHNLTWNQYGVGTTPFIMQYDNEDRVISQQFGNDMRSFDYQIPFIKTVVTHTITDENGLNPYDVTRVYEFDPATGYVTKKTDGLGNEFHFIRDANQFLRSEKVFQNNGALQTPDLELIKQIDYTNDALGNRLTETAVLKTGEIITKTWAYEQNRVTSEEIKSTAHPRVFRTEFTYYYDNGVPTRVKEDKRRKDDGSFQVTTFEYDTNGRLTKTILPDGVKKIREYTGDFLTRTYFTKPDDNFIPDGEMLFTYDAQGNLDTETDAEGRVTDYDYDDQERLIKKTNSLGHVTSYVYDVNGNHTQVVNDLSAIGDQGQVNKMIYNSENRLIQIQHNNIDSSFDVLFAYTYNSMGKRLSDTDAQGVTQRFTYDLAGRLIKITDNNDNYIEYQLDALGRRIKETWYDSTATKVRELSRSYDMLNRMLEEVDFNGDVITYFYDAIGNRVRQRDANGKETSFEIDALGRHAKTIDALSNEVVYKYSDRDTLEEVKMSNGASTKYHYDELLRVIEEISPDRGVLSYDDYDEVGNVKQITDARGIAENYSYDDLDRIEAIASSDTALNINYNYDQGVNGLGKLTTITDASGTTNYSYDIRGGLTEVNKTINGQTYTIHYGYDDADRLTKITYPSGREVNYERDTLGQIQKVTTTYNSTTQTVLENITYLPFGPIKTAQYGNNLNLTNTYDMDYRLDQRQVGTVLNHDYAYDVQDNIKKIDDLITSARDQSFDYDSLYRLTGATGVYGDIDYNYDSNDNRLSVELNSSDLSNYQYQSSTNRLEVISGAYSDTVGYDDNGNIISLTASNQTQVYDNRNNLVQVYIDAANVGSYTYNAYNQRVIKLANSQTTIYHYDMDGNLIAETDGNGTTLKEYIYIHDRALAMVDTSGLYYYHNGHISTPQLMTDQNQQVVWQADYNPFGEAVINTELVKNNLRFSGQYYDKETNLHYNHNRYYSPKIGRYIQSDPIGLLGGRNTYTYVNNKPTVLTDPLGLASWWVGPIIWGGCEAVSTIAETKKKKALESVQRLYESLRQSILNTCIGMSERCQSEPDPCAASCSAMVDKWCLDQFEKADEWYTNANQTVEDHFFMGTNLPCGRPRKGTKPGPGNPRPRGGQI